MPSYEFRVQYIDDVDPLNVLASIKHAEPTVPKKYTFVSGLPLYDQVPAMKKALRAPHKVAILATTLSCSFADHSVAMGYSCG